VPVKGLMEEIHSHCDLWILSLWSPWTGMSHDLEQKTWSAM